MAFRTSRKSDRVRLSRSNKAGARFVSESMSALIPDRRMVPCVAEFFPGEQPCDFTPKIFQGIEFVYVLNGSLCLTTPNERQNLGSGDVGWIDGRTARQYICEGHESAKAMIVTVTQE